MQYGYFIIRHTYDTGVQRFDYTLHHRLSTARGACTVALRNWPAVVQTDIFEIQIETMTVCWKETKRKLIKGD